MSTCGNAGAGACALPMALRQHFPKATIDAVDIDAEALDLAQCFFGAQEDAHLLLHNEDGVKFLTRPGVASQVCSLHTACCCYQVLTLLQRPVVSCCSTASSQAADQT